MSAVGLKICNKEEWESLATQDNIVIHVGMLVTFDDAWGSQVFNDAMVIDNYKDKSPKELSEEIIKCGDILIRRYASTMYAKANQAEDAS